jgi:predicted nucleic acid-binding protein
MDNIHVVDNHLLDKLAKIDRLELLRREGYEIVVTDKVYQELMGCVRVA